MNREGKRGRLRGREGEKAYVDMRGKDEQVGKGRETGQEGKVPGPMAGPTFHMQPWPKLGRCPGTRVLAQDVVFDDTLGAFPVCIGHRESKEKTKGVSTSPGSISSSGQQVGGSNPPSSAHPRRVFSPSKFIKTKMHSIPLKTKQINNPVILDR